MAITLARAARLLDYSSLAVLSAGALCYGRAYLGLRGLMDGAPGAARPLGALAEHARLVRLSQVGLAVLAAGIVMALVATAMTTTARRRARRSGDAVGRTGEGVAFPA
jgi:hypothetical protein